MAGRPLNAAGTDIVLTAAQEEFLDWLVNPERQGTQSALAHKLGVHPNTLTSWKRDRPFRDEWDKRLAALNVSPDRIQRITDAMYEAAIGGGPQAVKAMELYLRFVDRFTPKQEIVTRQTAEDLTDEELADALENVTLLRRTGTDDAPRPGETKRQAAIRRIVD